MSETSARLELPLIAAAQAQKHVTHNDALTLLDGIVQLTPQAFDATLPPISPEDGQVWALGTGVVNAWSGQDGKLALRANGGWLFIEPQVGWRAAIGNDLRLFDGAVWVRPALPVLQNLPGVGIGTSYDAFNPLAVAGPASLFTHAGGGHQIKLNKSGPSQTATILFQTGFSGRAEIGTAGNDDLSVKVSPDGTSFVEAMRVAAGTGITAFPAGMVTGDGTATTPAFGFATDPDTGLFSAGPNILGLAAGGVEQARITTAGLQATNMTVTGTLTLPPASVARAMLADAPALSLIGRSANTTGVPTDIAAATDHQVMRRSGTAIGFGAVALNQAAAVTGALAVANGGTGSTTAAAARTALGPGTAATTTVTTSQTDTPAGRLLKVADFGLGAVASVPLLANLDDTALAADATDPATLDARCSPQGPSSDG